MKDLTPLFCEYNNTDWLELKSSPGRASLKMPCCDRKAIPKTSKLGTQYFAHAKRGDCTSAPEGQEHLYLKSLVAKIAIQNGWKVTTEHSGQTPKGETWIADVFCQKGTAKLVFEIQWSYQTLDEYERRT
jgi:competence CoiA-like predicted nuclease